MKKNITIYQIAEELNISPSTVSRVLNNSNLISKEKHKVILETAKRLGYKKKITKRQKNRTILNIILFLPYNLDRKYHLFYDTGELINGIKDGFGSTKVNIITETTSEIPYSLKSNKLGNIDGAIFAFNTPSEEIANTLNLRTIPFIVLNRELDNYNYITIDSNDSMDKLFSNNYLKNSRVLYLGLSTIETVNETRKKSFILECEKREIKNFLIEDVDNYRSINPSLIKRLKNNNINWVLCFNDLLALSLYDKCKNINYNIKITGQDNSPIREIYSNNLSTIDLKTTYMGNLAGKWLSKWIIDREYKTLKIKLPATYIEGNI